MNKIESKVDTKALILETKLSNDVKRFTLNSFEKEIFADTNEKAIACKNKYNQVQNGVIWLPEEIKIKNICKQIFNNRYNNLLNALIPVK